MSTIEWTDATWNPTIGCRRVSSGCDHCYAINVAHRFASQPTHPHYAGVTVNNGQRVDWTGRFNVAPEHILTKPLRTSRPTTFFVNSMSDLFGEGVTDETIQRVFRIMNDCPQHRFQVLTKRPNRAVKMASSLTWTPNIWMGTSIEEDKFSSRAGLLRKIPAAIRFLSCEPLLGPLPSLSLFEIDWVIVGGESGPGSRPMAVEWARDLRDRCVAGGTAFFFKQWGNWTETGVRLRGKKDAGRELDGREWNEMPTPRAIPSPWRTLPEFRADLSEEHDAEPSPPLHAGASPRLTLREPIWRTLRAIGPLDAKTLRTRVLESEGLDATSARIVNYHAWALVDLQKGKFVESFEEEVPGESGMKRVKLYRATKPRVRVLQTRS